MLSDDKDVKARVLGKYGFVDEDVDKRYHRPNLKKNVSLDIQALSVTMTPVRVTIRLQWHVFGPKKDLLILKIIMIRKCFVR